MKYRPSQMPRLDRCPASKKEPKVLIDRAFDAQKQGNAVHDALHHYLTAETPGDQLEFGHIIEREDLENIPEFYRNFWSAIRYLESLEGIEIIGVEKKLKSNHYITFDGTCDVLFLYDSELYVLDWKTGRVERDYKKQLETYLVLACEEMGYKKGHIVEFYTQTSTPFLHTYQEGFIDGFYENLERIAIETHYDPSSHCEFCPLFYECEARQLMLKASIRIMSDMMTGGQVNNQMMAALYDTAGTVSQLIDDFKTMFKQELEVGGSIQTETHEFTVIQMKKRKILFDKALPELLDLNVNPTEMQDLKSRLTLGVTVFKEFLKKNTPPGEAKGKFIVRILDELEDRGALAVGYTKRTSKKKRKV